jgi:hypothetical protein
MDQLTTLNDKIESNQTILQKQVVASGERMKELEDLVIKSFDSINSLAETQQTSLEQSMTETNERLTVLSNLLTTMITNKEKVQKRCQFLPPAR